MKIFLLVLSDTIALYAALFLTLLIRYGIGGFYSAFWNLHAGPFTVIFIIWLLVFYIAGLYDLRRLRDNLQFLRTFGGATIASGIIATVLFYLVPAFGITPKTNLAILLLIFGVIQIFWRRWLNAIICSQTPPNKLLLVGEGPSAENILQLVNTHPELGYEIRAHVPQDEKTMESLEDLARSHDATMIVVPRHLRYEDDTAIILFKLLSAGIEIRDLTNFYELIAGKVPLLDLEEAWFLENLLIRNPAYEFLKRVADIAAAIVLGAITIVLFPFIALAVKLSSPGPVLKRQARIGKSGKPYTHYKFRTMRETVENKWLDEDHARITPIGHFLRRTHIDEFPQSINLLRGEISLVGPRPDFGDFFEKLKTQIPYYSVRTIVKPGLTGWAQINMPTTISLEETKERLCYDIYYLKNRSLTLDMLIILKTLKAVVTASGK